MRNGWMRFMWPTWPTVGFNADVAGQHAIAALAAAEPVSPSRSRLSSNRRWTLTWRMRGARRSRRRRFPCRGTAPGDRSAIALAAASRSRKARSENIWASSERSCRWRSVACSGTSSTKTCDTGLPSGESKAPAREAHESAASLLQSLDPAMRNRDALAETGGAQLLARGKARGDGRAREAGSRRTAPRSPRTAATSSETSRSSAILRGEGVRRSGSSGATAGARK